MMGQSSVRCIWELVERVCILRPSKYRFCPRLQHLQPVQIPGGAIGRDVTNSHGQRMNGFTLNTFQIHPCLAADLPTCGLGCM